MYTKLYSNQGRRYLIAAPLVCLAVLLLVFLFRHAQPSDALVHQEQQSDPRLSQSSTVLLLMNVHASRQDRLDAFKETWVPHAKIRLRYFTSNPDLQFQPGDEVHLYQAGTPDADKTLDLIRLSCALHPETRWYGKFDDDTYVNVPELVKTLSRMDASAPIAMGNSYNWKDPFTPDDFMSGGAGWVLSHAAAHALAPIVRICKVDALAKFEDVTLDYCLRNYVQHERVNNLGFHWATPERFVLEGIMTIPRMIRTPITYHYVDPQRRRSLTWAQPAPRVVYQCWPFQSDFETSDLPMAVRMRQCRERMTTRGWEYHLISPANWNAQESCGGSCSSFRYADHAGPTLRELMALLERLYLRGGLALHSSASCGEEAGNFDLGALLSSSGAGAPMFGVGQASIVTSPEASTAAFVALAASPIHHDVFRLYGLVTTTLRSFDPHFYTKSWQLSDSLRSDDDRHLTAILGTSAFVHDVIKHYLLQYGTSSMQEMGLFFV